MSNKNKRWFVDIPPTIKGMSWCNVAEFDNKKEALQFVKKEYGADNEGRVCLISYCCDDDDE